MMEWVIDPRNFGEVVACGGLAHLAWREDRTATTGFEIDADGRARFRVPGPEVMQNGVDVTALEETGDGLRFAGIDLDWWREWGLNPGLKLWAGQQTPLTVHRSLQAAAGDAPVTDWLTHATAAAGRLNVDASGTWNALRIGWSLNEHKGVQMQCRPWVELLASIGLQAFPIAGDRRGGGFRYSLWRPSMLPAAAAAFGDGRSGVYAIGRYHAMTAKSGSNTIIRTAVPMETGNTS